MLSSREPGRLLTARDEDYRSTPLAWAARSGLPELVELLLAHGSPTRLPDDEPWAGSTRAREAPAE